MSEQNRKNEWNRLIKLNREIPKVLIDEFGKAPADAVVDIPKERYNATLGKTVKISSKKVK